MTEWIKTTESITTLELLSKVSSLSSPSVVSNCIGCIETLDELAVIAIDDKDVVVNFYVVDGVDVAIVRNDKDDYVYFVGYSDECEYCALAAEDEEDE